MISDATLKNIGRYDSIALAVSGGRDSMAMLDFFISEVKTDFFVVNIEHGIRGESSRADSLFVERYCAERGVRFEGRCVDAPAYARKYGATLEQAARILRHRVFKEFTDAGKAQKVALAHHVGDAAESVLMHILRGCGVDGLVGMREDEGYILRPLLKVSPADIDAYVKKNRVPYRDDETNADGRYARNFIRLKVMPLIEEIYPDAARALLRLSENAFKVKEFLDGFVRKDIRRLEDGSVFMPDTAFEGADAAIEANIKRALTLADASVDFESKHYGLLKKLAASGNSKRLSLAGVVAERENGGVALFRNKGYDFSETPFSLSDTRFADFEIKCAAALPTFEKGALYIDSDKVPQTAVFRFPRDGDRFKPYGGGVKSLGDYFTDKKIPLRLRRGAPVIADGSRVLAVLATEAAQISDLVKIDAKSKNIYRITCGRTKENV